MGWYKLSPPVTHTNILLPTGRRPCLLVIERTCSFLFIMIVCRTIIVMPSAAQLSWLRCSIAIPRGGINCSLPPVLVCLGPK